LASVQEQYLRDFAGAEVYWKRVFAIDPRHARARAQRALWGLCYRSLAPEDAVEEARRASQDDPLNSWVGAMYSHLLGFAGRHAESLAEAERSWSIDPDSFFAHWNLLRACAMAGDHARAIELAPAVLAASGRHPWALGVLAWTFAKAGSGEHARAVHDEMEARARYEYMSPFWLATAAAAAGLPERTINQVERTLTEHDPLLGWGRASPFWDGVTTHPRFEEVVRGVWA
jgi:tetratricopeptide (TPR) repeat protein